MNILDYGARNGEFCGDAIQRAIDAAAALGYGTDKYELICVD